MRNLFFYLLLGALSIGSLHAETQVLSGVKVLTATTVLKTSDDKHLSVITVPAVYDTEGRIAKGMQEVDFTLNGSSPYSINVSDKTVAPGQSVNLQILANSLGGLDIPVYSESMGLLGDAMFSLSINSVKALSCPVNWTESGNTCYQIDYKSVNSWKCPSNYIASGKTNYDTVKGDICYKNGTSVADPSATCRSGYTAHKWAEGFCTDSKAFESDDEALCKSRGGEITWTNGAYACSFISPQSYQMDTICSGDEDMGRCVDKNTPAYTEPRCPSGYSYDSGEQCKAIKYRPIS